MCGFRLFYAQNLARTLLREQNIMGPPQYEPSIHNKILSDHVSTNRAFTMEVEGYACQCFVMSGFNDGEVEGCEVQAGIYNKDAAWAGHGPN